MYSIDLGSSKKKTKLKTETKKPTKPIFHFGPSYSAPAICY